MYKPHYTITHNLLTYLNRIEAAKALIENAPLVPAWEAKFRDDALVRTVHFGTKIEGNELTQAQAQQVVRLEVTIDAQEVERETGILARERDIQEVINYRNVIVWINQQDGTVSPDLFSQKTLKTLHQLTTQNLVDEGYIGEYRDKQVIVKSAVAGGVVFRPPVSVEVPFLIEEFFKWLNHPDTQHLPAIFRAAITHYQLVHIHPFIEGNGRTARALATLVLYTTGYDFKRFFSLEQYLDKDVQAYYDALLSVQQNQERDMTYWLEYFCYGLAIEIERVKDQVLRLSKDLRLKKELGQQVALSERQIIVLELLQNQGQITSQDAQKSLPNISVDTILRDMKDLIEKKVIEKHGVTKGVSYSLKE
ncbi:Fic family protein [Patescibacteria group bacterium]|nr:Fic family protein [Patescibacteria group bacterium]MBU1967509.1 Fic family protein [Patescibacteria group bacterium]